METTGTALSGSVDSDLADDFESAPVRHDASLPVDRFLDREASWLAFNRRVLELAEDTRIPLLERLNYFAIFAGNLDEFFMVRVAGLKRRIETGIAVPTNIGRGPHEVLADIHRSAHKLQERHAAAFAQISREDLVNAGIQIDRIADLGDDDRAYITDMYLNQIFPVLTPLAVDPAHPFPYISGLSMNLAVRVRNPRTDEANFARVKVPGNLPRFVSLPDDGSGRLKFVTLDDLISHHLSSLFPGMEILDHHAFRLTRNEDMEIDEDESENLIQALEAGLSRRRFGEPIRLEISTDMDDVTLGLLVRELGLDDDEVYRLPGILGLDSLFEISGIRRPELKFPNRFPPPWQHFNRWNRAGRPIFSRPCATAKCWCTTPMNRSPPACRHLSNKPQLTPQCWLSNKPCTAPAEIHPSFRPSSLPQSQARAFSLWSN